MTTLHDLELSGNCYKVRLFCSLIGIPLELRPVDFMGGEHKSANYLALNPFGEIPILEDQGIVFRDSRAILTYLARREGREDWLPIEAVSMSKVMGWLSVDANEIYHGPNAARLHDKFGYRLDVDLARERGHRILQQFEAHLAHREWLELGRPTIADVACFPYLALAREGGISLDKYADVRAWFNRIRSLQGFLTMPGID